MNGAISLKQILLPISVHFTEYNQKLSFLAEFFREQ